MDLCSSFFNHVKKNIDLATQNVDGVVHDLFVLIFIMKTHAILLRYPSRYRRSASRDVVLPPVFTVVFFVNKLDIDLPDERLRSCG